MAERLKLLQQVGLPGICSPRRAAQRHRPCASCASISSKWLSNPSVTCNAAKTIRKPMPCRLPSAGCANGDHDQLVDLFVRVLNDIRLRAKQRVEREILADFIRVEGKQQLLFRLAGAMWDNPDGIIRDVLYPLVGEERLRSLVQEAKATITYQRSVQTRVSGSYTHHYRQILPPLLEVLTFFQQCISISLFWRHWRWSLPICRRKMPSTRQTKPCRWRALSETCGKAGFTQRDKTGQRRIRRVHYELCVLQSLRDKLRCKELWVEGADRYRNPDEDVPADFSDKRHEYYASLALPLDGTSSSNRSRVSLSKLSKCSTIRCLPGTPRVRPWRFCPRQMAGFV